MKTIITRVLIFTLVILVTLIAMGDSMIIPTSEEIKLRTTNMTGHNITDVNCIIYTNGDIQCEYTEGVNYTGAINILTENVTTLQLASTTHAIGINILTENLTALQEASDSNVTMIWYIDSDTMQYAERNIVTDRIRIYNQKNDTKRLIMEYP